MLKIWSTCHFCPRDEDGLIELDLVCSKHVAKSYNSMNKFFGFFHFNIGNKPLSNNKPTPLLIFSKSNIVEGRKQKTNIFYYLDNLSFITIILFYSNFMKGFHHF